MDKLTRNRIPGVLTAAGLLFLVVRVGGQAARAAVADSSTQPAPLPYTAEFKSTVVRNLPSGGSVTTESTEIIAVDSRGRRMHSSTTAGQDPRTEVYVADPVGKTIEYWTVPGTTGQIVHMPDLGMDTDCSRKLKAINPLHPANVPNPRIQDLGTKTILGIPARGGRVSFTMGTVPRTNEMWTAIDPALNGLALLTIGVTGQSQTWTEQLTRFTQAEPDPKLFVMPEGREITEKNGMAYICGGHLGTGRASTPPAK